MPEYETNERAPSLGEVIRRALRAEMLEVMTCIPAAVSKYDASAQKADVKILVKETFLDEEEKRQVESWPIVSGVPVAFWGAGDFRMVCNISDGSGSDPATTGVLFFAMRSIDKWLTGSGAEVDPEIDHTHHLPDAIFVPGLRPFGAPLQTVPTDGTWSIGSDSDGTARVEGKKNTGVQLGAGATKGVARQDDKAGGGQLIFTGAGSTSLTSLTVQYVPGDGSSTQTVTISPTPPTPQTINIKEKITSASSKITAID